MNRPIYSPDRARAHVVENHQAAMATEERIQQAMRLDDPDRIRMLTSLHNALIEEGPLLEAALDFAIEHPRSS